MEMFLYYLLRASVLIALFYGFYKLFLAGSTFHIVNRIVLICIVLSTFLLPFFRFKLIPEKKPDIVMEMLPADLFSIPITEFVEPQPQMEIHWIQILMVLFAVGFLFAFIRYMAGLVQLFTIIRKSEKQTLENHTILCVTDENISPFSWMKYIVLPRKEQIGENEAVIRHEMSHLHLQHSWDMFFFDLFTCLFWFNPFSWLLRQEIQTVHEFQADEEVLLSGINAKQYQLLLIRKSVGENKFALANNFRRRDLHKRITMMKKEKTNRLKKWNYAMLIPALFLAMVALSVPKLNAKAMEKEVFSTDPDKITVKGQVVDEEGNAIPMVTILNQKDNSGTVTDSNGEFVYEANRGDVISFVMENYKERKITFNKSESNFKVVLEKGEGSSQELITVRIKGKDDVGEINNDPLGIVISGLVKSRQGAIAGALVTIKGTGKGTVTDMEGKFLLETEVGNTLVIQMINYKTVEFKVESAEKNKLSVLLEPEEDGTETTDKTTETPQNELILTADTVWYSTGNSTVHSTFNRTSVTNTPLIIVDGTIVPNGNMHTINPDNIESISILKDKAAVDIYGDKGGHGVILIKTKKNDSDIDVVALGESTDSLINRLKELSSKKMTVNKEEINGQNLDMLIKNRPLIIVDDEKMPKDFQINSIDVSDIESLSVLKDQSAIDVYGDEGKNGVIIINIKKTD